MTEKFLSLAHCTQLTIFRRILLVYVWINNGIITSALDFSDPYTNPCIPVLCVPRKGKELTQIMDELDVGAKEDKEEDDDLLALMDKAK